MGYKEKKMTTVKSTMHCAYKMINRNIFGDNERIRQSLAKNINNEDKAKRLAKISVKALKNYKGNNDQTLVKILENDKDLLVSLYKEIQQSQRMDWDELTYAIQEIEKDKKRGEEIDNTFRLCYELLGLEIIQILDQERSYGIFNVYNKIFYNPSNSSLPSIISNEDKQKVIDLMTCNIQFSKGKEYSEDDLDKVKQRIEAINNFYESSNVSTINHVNEKIQAKIANDLRTY